MTSEVEKEEKSKSEAKEIIFKCKFCENPRPLAEMVVLTRFFPPVVVCRGCEKKMR